MKILTTIDLLALPSLETPPTGHVGFGAKADGLYQKIGTTETKLSVDGHTHTFASLTGKPTTLAGYGITDAANINHTHAYLPLVGGTISGNVLLQQSAVDNSNKISWLLGSPYINSDGSFVVMGVVGLSGDNNIYIGGGTSSFKAATNIAFFTASSPLSDEIEVMRISRNGYVGIGTTLPTYKLDVIGTGRFTDIVTAPTFSGNLIGNASTATKLQTSRTLWGRPFDGSGNVDGALTGVTTITASTSVTVPKVIFAAAGWSVEQTGTEIQFKYNNVVKQRLLSDGSIVAVGEVTAFGATS